MVIFAGMPKGPTPWNDPGSIPMFSKEEGGIIVHADAFDDANGLLCSYPYDPHTLQRTCSPLGVSEQCIPGCQTNPPGQCNWCSSPGCRYWGGCAYRGPGELRAMLGDYASRKPGDRGYNEVVLSEERWQERMPSTVEAFFYLNTNGCSTSPQCKQRVQLAYQRFVDAYPQSGVVLLTLDPHDWEKPFAVVPSPGS
jgi:hypothetical protein